jgi:hypothetical protein
MEPNRNGIIIMPNTRIPVTQTIQFYFQELIKQWLKWSVLFVNHARVVLVFKNTETMLETQMKDR